MVKKTAIGLLLAAAILAPAASSAGPGITKGVKVGLNLSTLSGPDSDIESAKKTVRIGVAGGIFGEIGIAASMLSVEIDALYSMKGAKYEVGDVTSTTQLDYLDIPVLLKYELNPAPTRVCVYGGPALGVLLNATVATEAGDVDISEDISSADLGIVVGAGVGLPGGFLGELRYTLGLTSIARTDAGQPDQKIYNSLLQVMVGYSF